MRRLSASVEEVLAEHEPLEPADVALLMSFLWRAGSPAQAARTLEPAIDGVRAR